jgi:hypothetical protein
MAHLFVVENGVAKPNTETLLISPFREIWERDETNDKQKAIKEFTFIEFMMSKKKSNPYAGYSETVRLDKVKESVFNLSWQPDILIEQAMAKMREFQKEASPTYSYYMDSLETAERTREFLKNIDLNERNDRTGNPLYKPKDVTSAIIDAEKVILTLATLKDKVEQELFDTTKTKGMRQINYFET